MDTIKMWALREEKSSPPISIRSKHEDAIADGKRLGLQKFEVMPVYVDIRDVPLEEIHGKIEG